MSLPHAHEISDDEKIQDVTEEHALKMRAAMIAKGKCGSFIVQPDTRIYLCEKAKGHEAQWDDEGCSDSFKGRVWEWCDRGGPSAVVNDEMRESWKVAGHTEPLYASMVKDWMCRERGCNGWRVNENAQFCERHGGRLVHFQVVLNPDEPGDFLLLRKP